MMPLTRSQYVAKEQAAEQGVDTAETRTGI